MQVARLCRLIVVLRALLFMTSQPCTGHKIGPLVRTEHGFDNQLAANHMGHFLLTQCLLTRMLKQVCP